MNSFTRLAALLMLAFSLYPHSLHALTEAESSSAIPSKTAPAVQMPQQMILSLKAAIAMALSRNIDLQVEAQNTRMASADAKRSHGIYDPLLTVSSTGGISAIPGEAFFYTKSTTTTVGMSQFIPTGGVISLGTQTGYFRFEPATTASKEWQSTTGISLSQPLLRNAGKETFELNITLAASTLQDSLERYRAFTNETVYYVITSYNRLYVLRQVYETREAALNSAQRLLDEITKKKPGPSQQLEIANAEFAIAQRRKDFIEAGRSVSDQETTLRYLIGLETPLHVVPSDPPSKAEPQETDEQAVKSALELRSDLKLLRMNLHTARLQERVSRHQTLPDLSLNASGGLSGTGYNFSESFNQIGSNPGTYWTAGMQFSVPLGNTSAHNDYIRSKIRAEQIGDQVRALSWKIRNEVENDMRALISARLQIQMTGKSSQFAEARLEQYRKNNKLNTATIQDVLNAENDLNIARNSQLEALETFANAVSKLWKDTGLLLDREGVHVNRLQTGDDAENQKPTSSVADTLEPVDKAVAAVAEPELAGYNLPLAASSNETASAGTSLPEQITRVTATLDSTPVANRTYTLTVGEYSNKSKMSDDIARIKELGLLPQVTQGPQRSAEMIRLKVGEFPSKILAQKALNKVQRYKASGFMQLNDTKKHVVYAGSFLAQESAIKEQARLAGHGIKVSLEKASVSFPTYLLTAGNFLGRDVALNHARKLEHLGVAAVVTEKP